MKSKGVAGSVSSKNKSKQKPNYKIGRPKSLNKEQLNKLLKLYYSEPVSIRTLAKMFGVSRMTVWRVVNDLTKVTTGRPIYSGNGGALYD